MPACAFLLVTNSADFHPTLPNLRASLERGFSSEYFTELLPSYIFGPRVVKCGILSNNRHNKLHAFIECQFFFN